MSFCGIIDVCCKLARPPPPLRPLFLGCVPHALTVSRLLSNTTTTMCVAVLLPTVGVTLWVLPFKHVCSMAIGAVYACFVVLCNNLHLTMLVYRRQSQGILTVKHGCFN